MKKQIMIAHCLFSTLFLLSCQHGRTADSMDPVQDDGRHYKVEFENAHIRVLRAHYGGHERSPLHSHPANIVITLTGGQVKATDASGTVTQDVVTEHSIGSGPALTHSIENLTDMPYEVVVIELKD
jgi:quercetin dioxygenase-like cupin family protein